MNNNQEKEIQVNPALRHYKRVVAFAVLGFLIGAGSLFLALEKVEAPGHTADQIDFTTDDEIDAFVLPAAKPVRIRVPAVGIDATFEGGLGLNEDQTVEVPDSYEEVGWYKYAPTPGELGPAIILGHVDSFEGPAVFWPLQNLEVGDEILVDREDGSIATFRVTELEDHAQSGFPTEKVYSDLDYAGLRLITCSGTFNHGIQRYSHNLIVFAELVDPSLQE